MRKKAIVPVVEQQPLVDGPPLRGHVVQHSDPHHLLIIDGVVVACTPTEYAMLMQLIEHVDEHVSFTRLVNGTFVGFVDRQMRRSLTQSMSRVRAKLWVFGFDIFCITGYGYTLLPVPSAPPEQEAIPTGSLFEGQGDDAMRCEATKREEGERLCCSFVVFRVPKM